MQILILLGSAISFIYLGILTYLKKIEEVKRNLPLILMGLAILFSAYSAPVLLLSFLEKKELERLAYFQSNPPSFPRVEVIPQSNSNLSSRAEDLKKECEEKNPYPDILTLMKNPDQTTIKALQEVENTIKNGDIDGYAVYKNGIRFLLCLIGSGARNDNRYKPGGRYAEWFINRLYQIKMKVPAIKNETEWFTTLFIIQKGHHLITHLCRVREDVGYYIYVPKVSVIYICTGRNGFSPEYERNFIEWPIAHEAAHALDWKLGAQIKNTDDIDKPASEMRESNIYKFFENTDPSTLILMYYYGFYGPLTRNQPKLCSETSNLPALVIDTNTIKEAKNAKAYGELFAYMYQSYLLCDGNIQLPNDNTLKGKLKEFINILRGYKLL
jgi:hypothetical protein